MRRIGGVSVLVALVLAGCDSAGPADRLPEELAGTWTADASCEVCTFLLTSVANPELNIDLLDPPVSATVELELRRSGSAALNISSLGQTSGSARVEGNMLILTALGSADTVDYVVAGNTLTLDFRGDFELVDFTGDAVPDPAHGRAVLRRE